MNGIIIFCYLLFFAYLLLLAMYRKGWQSIHLPGVRKELNFPMVTIIIPARNEEFTLPSCLECIIKQQYPDSLFEIIVIDDHSEDNTASVAARFPKTRVLSLSDYPDDSFSSFKKRAITLGVSKAVGEIIITTDADCEMGVNWIRSIVTYFQNNRDVKIVAGPVNLIGLTTKGIFKSAFSAFQQVDFMMFQGITAGGIGGRFHHLCNGANLAYRKDAFYAVDGFSGNEQQPSGDDIFLMQKMVSCFPGASFYLKSRDAIVKTRPARTVGEFIQQRIRWAGKSAGYSEKTILPIMGLVLGVNLCVLLPGLICVINPNLTIFQIPIYIHLGFLWLIKIFSEYLLFFPVSEFFGQPRLRIWILILQPLHVSYTVSIAFLSLIGTYKWKGRNFKKKGFK